MNDSRVIQLESGMIIGVSAAYKKGRKLPEQGKIYSMEEINEIQGVIYDATYAKMSNNDQFKFKILEVEWDSKLINKMPFLKRIALIKKNRLKYVMKIEVI